MNKHIVGNNEFYLNYLAIKALPEGKFLFYLPYLEPEYENNRLFGLQLSGYVFRTDQVAIYLQELDLRFVSLVSEQTKFFRNKGRRMKLKEMLEKASMLTQLLYKITSLLRPEIQRIFRETK